MSVYKRWTILGVAGGIILRVLWVFFVPPVQLSDFANYIYLSRDLQSVHSYASGTADLPPGEPAFLALGLWVSDRPWTPAFLNLICYVLLSAIMFLAARKSLGKVAPVLAVWMLAVWPSYIALTGIAASEHPFLLLFFIACLPAFFDERWIPLCGVAAGLAALVRPEALLVPIIWVVALAFERKKLARMAFAGLLLIATIAPWTIRNEFRLHAFVPISTNGGDVFYRANNPQATGGWTRTGEQDLRSYSDDLQRRDRLGYQLGKAWIRSHPLGFLRLVARKQIIFMRTDNAGVYWS